MYVKICAVRTESMDHFLWNCPAYSQNPTLFLEHLKKTLGKEFEDAILQGNHVSFWGSSFGGVVMRSCCA